MLHSEFMLGTVEKFKLPIKFHCLEDKNNKTLISVLLITFNSRSKGGTKSLLSSYVSTVAPPFNHSVTHREKVIYDDFLQRYIQELPQTYT